MILRDFERYFATDPMGVQAAFDSDTSLQMLSS